MMVFDPPTDHIGIAYRYTAKIATSLHKSSSEPKLVVRKDLKNSRSLKSDFPLSKKPKMKRIGRENNSGAFLKTYRRTGGGPHQYSPNCIPELQDTAHIWFE